MEEEACGEEEEEDGERREGEVTFLGEGDYDRFPAPSPEWKHVGGVCIAGDKR